MPDNVQRKAFIYRYDQGTWRDTPIPLPTNENVSLSAASEETDVVLFTVSNYLGPTSLWYFDAASEGLEILRTTPPKFNPSRHVAKQFEATSLDGTRIPTFWCVPRTRGSERRSNSFQWLWRIPRLAPAILCGSDGAALARPGQCICRREPAGRRRVWAGMARGGPSGNEAADMG